MSGELLRDFRAEDPIEAGVLARLQGFLAQNGDAAWGREIAGEIGHVTAGACVVSENSRILLVWGSKESAWKLPGAHCEADSLEVAAREAKRALGRDLRSNGRLDALHEREIAPYWNTPAHRHFEMVFRFDEAAMEAELPRGARWFSLEDAAQLGDALIARLARRMILRRSDTRRPEAVPTVSIRSKK